MDVQTVKLLAKYNAAANAAMNELISGLSSDQWETKFKGYFASIKAMCNHLYIGDFNWLKRFSKLRPFAFAQNPFFAKDIKFSETVFGSVGEYTALRKELDDLIIRFADEVAARDFTQDLAYVDSHGNAHTKNFGGLILHAFNHQTHHRGMISLYLEELGIANDYSNLNSLL
jgi:uncharacterized damage-inducible protein DinB